MAVLKGDGSSLPALPVSFAIIAEQGGRLVGWLVGKGKEKKEKKEEKHMVVFVCLVPTGNREPGTTVVVVVAVVKRGGEQAQMNERMYGR